MQKIIKAAIIVAVFLMFAQNGCYTRLKSIKPNLEPEPPAANSEWDFGNGWYWNEHRYDNSYYGYHHLQWWDDVTWLTDTRGKVDWSLDTDLPKVSRRDDDNITYNSPVLTPSSPNGLNLSGTQSEKAGDQNATPAPLTEQKGNGVNSNNSNDNDSHNSNTKKKRGR